MGSFAIALRGFWDYISLYPLLGPSSFEGPQKHDLTMFLEYNI
jgi:hypothetical protein